MVISNSDIAQRQDFTCRRGDTFTRNLTFTFNGTSVPLTGCTLAMKVADGSGNVILTISPTIAGNIATLVIPASAMLVTPGNYLYDMQLTNTDGSKVALIQGWFTVDKDITA